MTTLLLHAHKAALRALITANNAAHVDSAGRFALDGITARASRMIEAIDFLIANPHQFEPGLWGEHGKGPLIRSMIREAGRVRELSLVEEAA